MITICEIVSVILSQQLPSITLCKFNELLPNRIAVHPDLHICVDGLAKRNEVMNYTIFVDGNDVLVASIM